MKKLVIFMLIFSTIQIKLLGQIQTKSVLTNSTYLENPKKYLSKLDSTKIQSGILIDRVLFNDLILNNNGSNLVSVLNCSDWAKLYKDLRSASYDTSFFTNWDNVKRITDNYYSQRTICLSLMDFSFDRIKQAAIDSSQLMVGNDYLKDNNSTINSFSNHRIVAVSCNEFNIVGDNLKFLVGGNLFFTNNHKQKIKTIEIDFGNGEGYKKVNLNEIVNVNYNSNSGYIELKVKLEFEGVKGDTELLYSHCTVYRTGSSTVPPPDNPSTFSNSFKSTPLVPDGGDDNGFLYYPVGEEHIEYVGGSEYNSYSYTWWSGRELEYCFKFAPNNTSGKLRRPFIVVDGFDPGNSRDYYATRYDAASDLLPKERDFRGLSQLLNGDPSPWYDFEPDVGLIQSLRNEGYDLVFVNFLDGAGDVPTNANSLRGFLNNVINSPTWRDSKTEEAILVGPSMGGLITRYALTSMEQAVPREDHFVKMWVSFDSPQKGAYIPLGLQHTMDFFTRIHDFGGIITLLTTARDGFIAGVKTLNTTAAKQMLLSHFTQTNSQANHTIEFDNLYNSLNQLGYPKYSKNLAISNGGETKLYEGASAQIVQFNFPYWTWTAADAYWGISTIFQGSRQGWFNDETINISSQIPYENAPGGWNAALYSLNCRPENDYVKPETMKQFTRATFMVTSSAFGIPVTSENVYNTWRSYTGCSDNVSGKIKTPFDEVHGMFDNEEHVKISNDTKDYLIDNDLSVLHREFDNTQRPQVRDGQTITQSVNGKVAYVAKQSLTLGGNGNSYLLENGSEVNAMAGNSISFLPGFEAKAGASFTASIGNVNYGTTFKTDNAPLKSAHYSKPSPYLNQIYDYSISDLPKYKTTSIPYVFSVFPNPAKDNINIEISGVGQGLVNVQIISIFGQVMYSINVNNGSTTIDISGLNSGVYMIKTSYGSYTQNNKIVKL